MSKKERLEKKIAKQEKLIKQQQETEQLEIEASKENLSKSARKMLKKAKKEKKHRYEGGLFLFLKILMLAALLYSGVFYGGVTVIGVLSGYMEEMSKWVAAAMGIGTVVILIGIILSFCKKYPASFVVITGGTISYMKAATHIVSKISSKLETYSGSDQDLMDMDRDYMLHYYPILIIMAIALIFAIITVVKFIRKRKKLKEERDNAPVRSIINS